MSSPGRRSRSPQRILLIKPSSLGDIVHALPVLAGLRDAYPEAHIAWLVGSSFAPLLENHPLLDEVISFDRRGYGQILRSWRSLVDFVRFCAGLHRRRFDLVVDLQGLFRSGFFALVTGARQRIGFADARELAALFYTQRIRGTASVSDTTVGSDALPARTANAARLTQPWHTSARLAQPWHTSARLAQPWHTSARLIQPWHTITSVHAVERNLTLARKLGWPVEPPLFPLGLRREELEAAERKLAQAAGEPLAEFLAVLPGARWESKRWPTDRLAELIDQLHADGLPRCVLLGAPDERVFSDQLRRATRAPVVDLVGRTSLRELTALLARAALVVCHDSGPMHIAAALRTPLVAIFGSTSPARTGPYAASACVVALPLACAPCFRRTCPLGHHACMQQLAVDTVRQQVREVWAARPSSATCGVT